MMKKNSGKSKRILFLHMPKCAGTSMRMVLKEAVKSGCIGYKSLVLEYKSILCYLPEKDRYEELSKYLHNPKQIDCGQIIFGHFMPITYLGNLDFKTHDITLITFLRDPLRRLISHYLFWKYVCTDNHYLRLRMVGNNWTFYQFAMCDEMRNFYSQYFFQVPIHRFNYIGIHENCQEGWSKVSQFLFGKEVELPYKNSLSDYKHIINEEINLSEEERAEIIDFHSQDYFLYKEAKVLSKSTVELN